LLNCMSFRLKTLKVTLIIKKIMFFYITGRWYVPGEKYCNQIIHTYEYIIKNIVVIEDFILYNFKRVVEFIFSYQSIMFSVFALHMIN
jgi:hypothetical protein